MKNKQISSSEMADKIIDSRIINTLWEYIHDIKWDIKQETAKAWYILWFQWTVLFIASSKIWWIEAILPKVFLMILFLVSAFLSFYVIASRKSLEHISLLDKTRFDRSIALPELKVIYQNAQKSLEKKVLFNNINMLVQLVMLIWVLMILLFGIEIRNLLP